MPRIAIVAMLAWLWAGAAHSQTVTLVCNQPQGSKCLRYAEAPPVKPGLGGGMSNYQPPRCEEMSAPTHYLCTIVSDKPISQPTRVTLQK